MSGQLVTSSPTTGEQDATPEATAAPELQLIHQVVPQRGAAKRATQNLTNTFGSRSRSNTKQTSDAKDLEDDEDDGTVSRTPKGVRAGVKSVATSPAKHKTAHTYGSNYSGVADSSRTASSSPPSTPVLATRRKREESSKIDEHGASSPVKRRKVTSRCSRPSVPGPSPSFVERPSMSAASSSAFLSERIDDVHLDAPVASTSTKSLEGLAWARIDLEGQPVEEFGIWWPAQSKVSSRGGRQLNLLGERTPGAGSVRNKRRSFVCPSDKCLLPFRSSETGSARFDLQSFQRAQDGMLTTPSNLEDDWKKAVDEALQQDAIENDGLPDISFISSSQMTKAPNPSIEAVTVRPPAAPKPKVADVWIPEPTVTEGTLVLCRQTRNSKEYWPAKILKVQDKKKYRVIFLDGTEKSVREDCLHTTNSEEFLTCLLGEIETTDEEEEEGRKSPLPRDPSPALDSDAPNEDAFTELGLRAQIAYIRPILHLIIKGQYAPAASRHGSFIAGGRQRDYLSRNIPTGDLNPDEVHNVLMEIRRWALRKERWRERFSTVEPTTGGTGPEELSEASAPPGNEDAANIPSDKVPRPTGCQDYEAMEFAARSQYCCDVLLPEALIQLYTLRKGMRQGPIPLADEAAEAVLYETARVKWEDEKAPGAWVDQVLTIRQSRRIGRGLPANEPKPKAKDKEAPARGTTRSQRLY